jgi:hypothetical protein
VCHAWTSLTKMPKKHEYNGVTGGAEHFDDVLDGRVGLVRNICNGVVGLNKKTFILLQKQQKKT